MHNFENSWYITHVVSNIRHGICMLDRKENCSLYEVISPSLTFGQMPFDESHFLSLFLFFATVTVQYLNTGWFNASIPDKNRKPIIARRDRLVHSCTLFRGEQPQPPWRLSKCSFSFHGRHLCMLQEVTIYPLALISVSFGRAHEE